jgi:hypothetical protein
VRTLNVAELAGCGLAICQEVSSRRRLIVMVKQKETEAAFLKFDGTPQELR